MAGRARRIGTDVRAVPALATASPGEGSLDLYLLPFGDFDGEWSPRPSDLEAVASAFFQLPVQTLRAKPLEGLPVTVREREKGHKQYLSTDFLRMLRNELPDDGFCIVGITMQDLYPDPRWNYVFGQASLKDRVGIYSFARYDPQFWNEPRTDAAKTLLLVRSLAVLLHETSHIFGMKHCVYYRCLVNGSNSLAESDRQPMHLCPVCLRKLQSATGCDLFQRDPALQKEYARLGIKAEADWIARRLKYVTGG